MKDQGHPNSADWGKLILGIEVRALYIQGLHILACSMAKLYIKKKELSSFESQIFQPII